MDGITLASHGSADAEPLLRDLRSEVDAAWEEHAAKRSKKASPDKSTAKTNQAGQLRSLLSTPHVMYDAVLTVTVSKQFIMQWLRLVNISQYSLDYASPVCSIWSFSCRDISGGGRRSDY